MSDKSRLPNLPPYISDETGKIFVGGLSWATTHESLLNYFQKYGEVIDCVVMNNSMTGKSRGFGFVKYREPSCVDDVLSSGPHALDGRVIDPKACNPRSENKAKLGEKKNKIFVGGLSPSVDEASLKSFFNEYFGKVTEVTIMCDQLKDGTRGNSRGFGFVSFEDKESMEKICSQQYVSIDGKQVECKPAEPRDVSNKTAPHQGVWKMVSPPMYPSPAPPGGVVYLNHGSVPGSPVAASGPVFPPVPQQMSAGYSPQPQPSQVFYSSNAWMSATEQQYVPSSPPSIATPNFATLPSSPVQYPSMQFRYCTCETPPPIPMSPCMSPPSPRPCFTPYLSPPTTPRLGNIHF